MEFPQQNDGTALLENRRLFLKFNQYKIDQAWKVFSEPARTVFLTLPRLLHVNQKDLPGYVEGGSPCGIVNFTIDRQSQFSGEKLFPDQVIRRTENLNPAIHSLLLVGSMGPAECAHLLLFLESQNVAHPPVQTAVCSVSQRPLSGS